MITAPPDTRALQLDMYDAFCVRQVARIKQLLAQHESGSYARRAARGDDAPDHYEARGHAVGARRPNLSEIEGDE